MNLTSEDIGIFQGIAPELSATVEGDGIDFRAMLAREVFAERCWRIENKAMRPKDFVVREMYCNEHIRLEVERVNGEVLA